MTCNVCTHVVYAMYVPVHVCNACNARGCGACMRAFMYCNRCFYFMFVCMYPCVRVSCLHVCVHVRDVCDVRINMGARMCSCMYACMYVCVYLVWALRGFKLHCTGAPCPIFPYGDLSLGFLCVFLTAPWASGIWTRPRPPICPRHFFSHVSLFLLMSFMFTTQNLKFYICFCVIQFCENLVFSTCC